MTRSARLRRVASASRPWSLALAALLAACAAGCGDDDGGGDPDAGPEPPDAAIPDARPDARPRPDTGLPDGQCRTAADCEDLGYCSGDPQCVPISAGATVGYCSYPGRCFGGSSPCSYQTCNEAERRCDVTPYDGDGDGHYAVGCEFEPADDCVDWDPNTFPGNPEVCDSAGHDEDCDPTTVGPDVDGDGAASTRCCNSSFGTCGTDCDDLDAAASPTGSEEGANACDGVDNDCSGRIDDRCTCEAGTGDCDASPGCETDLATDTSSCGRCGNACGAGEVCIGGTCNPAIGVAVGTQSSCALRFDHSVWCWGGNRRGQLGDGTYTDREAPVQVGGLAGVAEIAAAGEHVCARLDDGTVRCWGYGGHGQLGDGELRTSPTPVAVAGISDAVELALGRFHSCVRHAGGTVSCWGYNALGQLGDGTQTRRATPVQVQSVRGATRLVAGGYLTCALAGGLLCWGDWQGSGAAVVRAETPEGAGGATFGALAAGTNHLCALDAGGSGTGDESFVCWGRNDAGELGDWSGGIPMRTYLPDIQGLFAGGEVTCAVRASAPGEPGALACYGSGVALGVDMYGSSIYGSAPPGLDRAESLAIGAGHGCAVVRGRVRCAGTNDHGQTGDGTTTYHVGFDSEVPGLR